MDKQKVLTKLIWDLQSFLSVLDSENLSYIAQAQKKSISELLFKLQTRDSPVEDAEYMIMTCPSSSPVTDLTDAPGTDGVCLPELVSEQDSSDWTKSQTRHPSGPPHPAGGLGGDDDDDDDEEDDTYEEAEPYRAADTMSNTERAESGSSHYESYGEEEEDEGAGLVKDKAHYIQWSSSQPCLRPAPESRLCGYLWRRKWLGQWSKQLFAIRNDTLLCYKCARDLLPQLEVNLRGCQLVYKSKSGGKIQHQLKLVPLGADTLVLGYSSFHQADEWRRVMEEASVGGEADSQSVLSLFKSDRLLSSRSSTVLSESDEEKPSAVGSWSRHSNTPSLQLKGQLSSSGFLNVLMNCQWQNLRCQVEAGLLNMFGEEEEEEGTKERSPQYTIQLRGCEVRAGPDTDRSYRITLNMCDDQVAMLEVRRPEEKERWLQLLRDGAADSTREPTGAGLSGLQTRMFPTSNTYMDDPFRLDGSGRDQPIYSNSAMLDHMLQSSQDPVHCSSVSSKESVTYSNTGFSSRKVAEVPRGVQKLDLTGRRTVQLRAGSEVNLASTSKQSKRNSFRQSLAVCTERAQAGFLNPLLRRTASAKNSLRRAPSALFIEHGKVFQRRKEWETKAAA
ncbi:actin filament-associated protein 1-like 2 [Parambassis ranga]|uniref:Actin filament-associated protein 1-like 2 n=1 Tax=Parambassis ranga TaxID=210632 RepID=A0A6P7J1Q0_9TELE|nr:actin filament-associated protein 1-like 2 [Parambassis ranga]